MKSTLEPSNPFTKTGGAMSGVSRFLSKREKGHKSHFYGKDIAGSKESHDVSWDTSASDANLVERHEL